MALVRMVDARGAEVLVYPSDVGPATALGWTVATTPPTCRELPIVAPGEPASQHHRATAPYPDPAATAFPNRRSD